MAGDDYNTDNLIFKFITTKLINSDQFVHVPYFACTPIILDLC
jgi:hypothetical protein